MKQVFLITSDHPTEVEKAQTLVKSAMGSMKSAKRVGVWMHVISPWMNSNAEGGFEPGNDLRRYKVIIEENGSVSATRLN